MEGHNRYLIYEMLGKNVDVESSPEMGGRRFKGFVDKVCRDIFDGTIVMMIDWRSHSFKEPNAIVRCDGDVMFLYGDSEPDTDEALFAALKSSYNESVYDVIKRMESRPRKFVCFSLSESSVRRRRLRQDIFHR
jgi:hypothetical protein